MKISNQFFIDQIRFTKKLVKADAIPDETTIVYAAVIGDQKIMSVYGNPEKAINTCFTILEELFDRNPSVVISDMMRFIEHFISSDSSEKIEGDPS